MSPVWIVALAVFLVLHGMVHLSYVSPAPRTPGEIRYPFDATRSWMGRLGVPPDALKAGAIILGMGALALFVASALSVMGWWIPKAWLAPLLTSAAVNSLLLLVLYWDLWFVAGIGINLALLAWVWLFDLPARVGASATGGA